MNSARRLRDSGLQPITDVQADVDDYVAAVFAGAAIQIELTYGWLFARRDTPQRADVAVYGPARGFCWRDGRSRVALRNRLRQATTPDSLARRGPAQEVWPL